MSTRFFTESAATPLTLNLEDGATDQYPRAFIFTGGSLVTSVDLGHVSLGRYVGTWVPGGAAHYDVLFITYTDALHTFESVIYTREMERWQNDEIIATAINRAQLPIDVADQVWDELLNAHTDPGSAGEFLGRLTAARAANIDDTNARVRLLEKIARNRLELMDGTTDNWILYDDDSVTPLLTFSVTDKNGAAIVQQNAVPSRRTRGV